MISSGVGVAELLVGGVRAPAFMAARADEAEPGLASARPAVVGDLLRCCSRIRFTPGRSG